MGYYDIDYDVLVEQSIPTKLRNTLMKAWLKCLVQPVRWLYAKFQTNRTANLYDMAHNGQVCKLEAVLNDTFDPTLRRIYIGDGPWIDPVFIYLRTELKDEYLALPAELPVIDYDAPMYLYTVAETSVEYVQFIVYYPVALTFDVERMKALINKYRLAGKKYYTIESF